MKKDVPMKRKKFFILGIFVFLYFGETSLVWASQQFHFKRIAATNGLFLRKKPGTHSPIITKISYLEVVKVFQYSEPHEIIEEKTGYWAEVEYNKTRGWVFDGFLEETNEFSFSLEEYCKKDMSILLEKTIITNNKKTLYQYTFNFLGSLPDEFYSDPSSFLPDLDYSEEYIEEIPLPASFYEKYLFNNQEPRYFYIVNTPTEYIIISNYEVVLINNGMYFFPVIRETIKRNFPSPTNLLLIRQSAFIDFTNRHASHSLSYEIISPPLPLKNHQYKKILFQFTIDLNGDRKKELISYVEKMYSRSDIPTTKITSVIVTFNNVHHIELFPHRNAMFNGIVFIPYHNYPAIRVWQYSLNSGDNMEYLILFEKSSIEPCYIPIDSSQSY